MVGGDIETWDEYVESFERKRKEQKAESRRSDERAVADGSKSRGDLARENGLFSFPGARIKLSDGE